MMESMTHDGVEDEGTSRRFPMDPDVVRSAEFVK